MITSSMKDVASHLYAVINNKHVLDIPDIACAPKRRFLALMAINSSTHYHLFDYQDLKFVKKAKDAPKAYCKSYTFIVSLLFELAAKTSLDIDSHNLDRHYWRLGTLTVSDIDTYQVLFTQESDADSGDVY